MNKEDEFNVDVERCSKCGELHILENNECICGNCKSKTIKEEFLEELYEIDLNDLDESNNFMKKWEITKNE